MTIRYGNPNVFDRATEIANAVLESGEFYDAVRAHKQFDSTMMSSAEVARTLSQAYKHRDIKVVTYRPRNPWSRANAYFTDSRPNHLNLNSRKNRTEVQWALTIIHEFTHAAGFGHGDNSRSGKGNTVPYGVEPLALEVIRILGL